MILHENIHLSIWKPIMGQLNRFFPLSYYVFYYYFIVYFITFLFYVNVFLFL